MSRIFISYRRDDTGQAAGRLCELISAAIGREQVFMDLGSIEAGVDFVREIERVITRVHGWAWAKGEPRKKPEVRDAVFALIEYLKPNHSETPRAPGTGYGPGAGRSAPGLGGTSAPPIREDRHCFF